MPADLIIRESELQGLVERTVLSIQNARARLAKTAVPILTDDFEVQFSGALLMDNGVNAIERETQTVAPGGTTTTTIKDPAQKTVTTQQPEEAVEQSNAEKTEEASANKADRVTDKSKRDSTTDDSADEAQDNADETRQQFGRETQVQTQFTE